MKSAYCSVSTNEMKFQKKIRKSLNDYLKLFEIFKKWSRKPRKTCSLVLKIANYEVFFISFEMLTIAFRGNTNILPKMCHAVIGEKKKKKIIHFFLFGDGKLFAVFFLFNSNWLFYLPYEIYEYIYLHIIIFHGIIISVIFHYL